MFDLSVETVPVHRRNIYEKLRISSLGKLFNLALKAATAPADPAAPPPLSAKAPPEA